MLLAFASAFAGNLVLANGSTVVVTDLASSDKNNKDRSTLIGEVCAVGSGGLVSSGDGWWKGGLSCGNGQTYALTAVAVAVPGSAPLPRSVSPTAVAAALGTTIKLDTSVVAVEGPSVGRADDTAPAGALRTDIVNGQAIVVAAISPQDAYYEDRAGVIGHVCTATDHLSNRGNGWHGGPVSCTDGESYYFFMAAFTAGSPTPAARAAPGTIATGTSLVIRDVAPDDAYFSDRTKIVGSACTVKSDLTPQGDEGWYGGGLQCKKDYYYFYKVRVDVK